MTTRFQSSDGSAALPPPPPVPRVDKNIYFTAMQNRPAFTDACMNSLFAVPESSSDGRPLFRCATARNKTELLPRFKDAFPAEKKAGAYATIGHIQQWQEFCAEHCTPEICTTPYGDALAYRKADVHAAYNDLTNLELQSQSYNSKLAYPYGAENPLTPTYI